MQMRSFGGLANTPSKLGLCSTTRGHSLLISSSAFSSSSGGSGRGRGRGIGRGTSPSPTDADDDVTEIDPFLPPLGLGHGRGKPIPSSTPIIPSFSPWNSTTNPSAGRGRPQPSDSLSQPQQEPFPILPSKKPIFLRRDDDDDAGSDPKLAPKYNSVRTPEEGVLPRNLSLGLPGAGRGKPARQPEPDEVNRHLRQRSASVGPSRGRMQPSSPSSPRLSREEAVKKAVGILSRGGGGVEAGGRGRGGRGRGRGRGGRGIQTPRFRGGRGLPRDSEDDLTGELYLGDDADGDRLVKGIGEENMNELIEGFEEMSGRVLPSLMEEAYLDALHTNNLIEYEPEYLMEEFGTNPDIDETPPIPLRDALEKMKPFLMAYEGIQSQKEWEEIMEETMAKVPYMKQLINIYSGPDRVTAKQQQEELERVAKTLPDNIPSSVKRFTDRAVLSLQSNPGWGFDKKCQFMDKLVWEVSQHYK